MAKGHLQWKTNRTKSTIFSAGKLNQGTGKGLKRCWSRTMPSLKWQVKQAFRSLTITSITPTELESITTSWLQESSQAQDSSK